MARPKKNESRDRQFNIALTGRELDRLHAAASEVAMRPTDYARARLFADGPTVARHAAKQGVVPTPHLDPLFMAQVSRIGNNINQIARRMNTFDLPAPPSLEPLLREIRGLIATGDGGDHQN